MSMTQGRIETKKWNRIRVIIRRGRYKMILHRLIVIVIHQVRSQIQVNSLIFTNDIHNLNSSIISNNRNQCLVFNWSPKRMKKLRFRFDKPTQPNYHLETPIEFYELFLTNDILEKYCCTSNFRRKKELRMIVI